MKLNTIIILGLLLSSFVMAEDRLEDDIRLGLSKLIPDVKIDSISPTPIDNLYQIVIGSDIIYMSRDGHYLLKGDFPVLISNA